MTAEQSPLDLLRARLEAESASHSTLLNIVSPVETVAKTLAGGGLSGALRNAGLWQTESEKLAVPLREARAALQAELKHADDALASASKFIEECIDEKLGREARQAKFEGWHWPERSDC